MKDIVLLSDSNIIDLFNKFSIIYTDNSWRVFKNNNSYPRAYVADNNQITQARIVSYTPNKVVIEKNEGFGTLVLSDTYFPGWEGSIDGEKTEIVKVNSIFRGIIVPAGKHTIIFEYKPKSFYWGAIVTIISSALTVCMFALLKRYSK